MRIVLVGLMLFLTLIVNAQTKIVAHRGFSGVAPENTKVAFEKAFELGVDYIELDCHKTADGQVVVIHDASINRTSNGQGKVEEMTLSELRNYDFSYSKEFNDQYEGVKISTLEEILTISKGKAKVCIEIKCEGIESKVVDLVHQLDMLNEVIVFAFDDKVVTNIRTLDKDIETLFLKVIANENTIDKAVELKANAIGVGPLTRLDKDLLSYATAKGIQIWKWTVNDEVEMKRLVDLGIYGVITNNPDKLKSLIN